MAVNLQVANNLSTAGQYVQDPSSNLSTLSLSSANIGIGTTSPDSVLDLYATGGTSGTSRALRVRAGNNYNVYSNNQVVLSWNGGTNYSHAIKTRHNGTAAAGNAIDLYLWKYGTDATGDIGTQQVLTLDGGNGGSVGIGTTSPGSALQVNGNAAIGYSSNTAGPSNGLAVNGSLGIGTNSPPDNVTVQGDNSAMTFRDSGATLGAKLGLESTNNGRLLLYSGGTPKVDLRASAVSYFGGGNVGIGTTNPTHALEVVGSATVDGSTLAVDATNHRVGIGSASPMGVLDVAGGHMAFNTSKGNYNFIVKGNTDDYLLFLSNNSVGIGSTAVASKLSVYGNASIGTGAAGSAAPTDGLLVWGTVGIGTTSPTAKLDVSPGTISDQNPNLRLRGTTSTVPSAGNDGDMQVYESGTTRRLYIKVNGTWRYATLT